MGQKVTVIIDDHMDDGVLMALANAIAGVVRIASPVAEVRFKAKHNDVDPQLLAALQEGERWVINKRK